PEGFVLARKSGFSAIWRGILKVWPNVVNGIQQSIVDGRSTRFWTDRWVDSGVLLIDHALNIQGVNASTCVADLCSANGDWNADLIFSVLPRDIALQVIGMSPPRNNIGQDSFIWGLEPTGKFTVRSAYQLLTDSSSKLTDPIWDRIWRWNGPNKIKHFLWLATHNRLFTNEERSRRHLTNQVVCSRCSLQTESLSHVLLDCQFALQVWEKTLSHALSERIRHPTFESWWAAMLKFHELSLREWELSLSHVYREANCAADYLANFGHSFSVGMYLFHSPDASLAHWLRYDLIGVALPRVIPFNN
ncbi:Putative ribonuclease H protein At1g65750, partial [Linum perenne]